MNRKNGDSLIFPMIESAGVIFCFLLAQWRVFFISPYLNRRFFGVDFFLWIFICVLIFWRLYRKGLLGNFYVTWKQNRLLALFIFFSACSLLWSIDVVISLYRLMAMMGASLVAAYVGARHGFREILKMFAAFFALLVMFNLGLILIFPEFGIMTNEPYIGSWRGIYWHRNYMGSAMALASLIFLFHLVDDFSPRKRESILYGLFYLLSFVLILMSRSATGMILFVLLLGAFLVAWAWVRWHSRMSARHYWIFGFTSILLIALILLNLDFVFGLLGRNTSLTGRVPLWNYLLSDVLRQKLFFGYGFGALWAQYSFREQVQNILHWGYPVLTADNGYLDVLLYLGIIGFVLFVSTLAYATLRYFRYALIHRNLVSALPLLFMVYMLVANLSLSHFFEIESFTWMVFLLFLFSMNRSQDTKQSQ